MEEAPQHMYVSVLEALDSESGDVLASAVFPSKLYRFIGPRVVYEKLHHSTGRYVLRLLRMHLER
jgi:hypothetical protein